MSLQCVFLTLLFVASLDPSASVNRNEERVIKKRITRSLVATLACLAITRFLLSISSFQEMGINPLDGVGTFKSILISLLLTLLLFLGPCLRKDEWSLDEDRWICIRNLLVGPLVEELVFRSCMTPILLNAGYSEITTVLLAPTFFGLAHLHHALAHYKQTHDLFRVFLVAGLQFSYTLLFGWFATFMLIRTKNIVGPILSHAFCNYMGLPDFDFFDWRPDHKFKTAFHTAAHLLGIYLFASLLVPLSSY